MRADLFTPSTEPDVPEEPDPISKGWNPIWLIVVLIVVGAGLAGWKILGPAGGGWLPDIDAGLDAAEATGKPVLVLFTADWCPPCRGLKSGTLSDPEIDAFLRTNYVLVRIDLSNRRGPNNWVAADHNVRTIPTMIVFDSEGWETERVIGGQPIASWIQMDAY
jgi:thiol:disulfide interchange protein